MKDTIKQVIEYLKAEVKTSRDDDSYLNILVRLNGEVIDVDIVYIDDSEVSYLNADRNLNKMKLKDFRLDLLRYNRDLVNYITTKL